MHVIIFYYDINDILYYDINDIPVSMRWKFTHK